MIKSNRVRDIAIVGGGTAGWMAAAILARRLGYASGSISVIESPQIGTIGVGEATIPPIRLFNNALGLNEDDFLRRTQGTIKLGIEFKNWSKIGRDYFHPFGLHGTRTEQVSLHQDWLKLRQSGDAGSFEDYSLNTVTARLGRVAAGADSDDALSPLFAYAFHFDGVFTANICVSMRRHAVFCGWSARSCTSNCAARTGSFAPCSWMMASKSRRICSSMLRFSRPADRAGTEDRIRGLDSLAALRSGGGRTLRERRRAHAFHPLDGARGGWQWRIPLQHRIGNGYVYCSRFISDDEAAATLLGQSRRQGHGRAAIFEVHHRAAQEILEQELHRARARRRLPRAAGIHQHPSDPEGPDTPAQFVSGPDARRSLPTNSTGWRSANTNACAISSFCTIRPPSVRCSTVELLRATWTFRRRSPTRFDQFSNSGRVAKYGGDLFAAPNWVAVLMGQGIWPERYDTLAGQRDVADVRADLDGIRATIRRAAEAAPRHEDYIAQHAIADDRRDNRIRSILIVGGGTAGWMAAATLARVLKNGPSKITSSSRPI